MNDAAVIAGMTATVVATIALAGYSSRVARTTGDFYVAARSVPAWWNASAISGEYLSAASFLGVAGLIMVGISGSSVSCRKCTVAVNGVAFPARSARRARQ